MIEHLPQELLTGITNLNGLYWSTLIKQAASKNIHLQLSLWYTEVVIFAYKDGRLNAGYHYEFSFSGRKQHHKLLVDWIDSV